MLSGTDVRTGQALADVATIGILAQRGLHQADPARQIADATSIATELLSGTLPTTTNTPGLETA